MKTQPIIRDGIRFGGPRRKEILESEWDAQINPPLTIRSFLSHLLISGGIISALSFNGIVV